MAKKNRELGNDTYFTIYNSDLKLIKDPVKKLLYSKIKNWIYRNEDKSKNHHYKNGYWWTYGTYEYWADECGLEIGTVGIHLRQLVKSGILINDNHNRMKSDKTYWYRLATNEEIKQVNFRLLFYGMSKYKNADNLSNETLYRMYKNGMLEVLNEDVGDVNIEVPLPEHITEQNTDHNLNYKTDYTSEDNSVNNTKKIKNCNLNSINLTKIIEDYNLLENDSEILNHVNHLSKLNIEDIPTETIKIFLDKFHEKKIESIENETKLFEYNCRIDGMYEKVLDEIQLKFCKDLVNKYYHIIISPQPAEQNNDEVSSTKPSPLQFLPNYSSNKSSNDSFLI
jgi:hypothetical protein